MRSGRSTDSRLKITNDKEQNMVNGIDLFREHFSDYKEQYTIIGGFACDLLMTDAGLKKTESLFWMPSILSRLK